MPSPTHLSVSSVPANLKLPANTAGRSASSPLARYLIFATLVVVGCATDLLTKYFIFAWRGFPDLHERRIFWLIEGFCGIETSLNPGALFGMGAGNSHWFALLAVLATIGIVVWLTFGRASEDLWITIALGLITGGILGNLYDRLGLWHFADTPTAWQNNVRDWILFRFGTYDWPNFNIADSCLVIGAGILVVHAFLTPAPAKADKGAA